MNPKKRETRRFKEKDDAGPVINQSAVETPHFFREVGALGMMRNGGAEIFPLCTSGDEAERRRRRDTRAERWMDEGLVRRHKVRLHLKTDG